MLFYFLTCIWAKSIFDDLSVVKGVTDLSLQYETAESEEKSKIREKVTNIIKVFSDFLTIAKYDPSDSLKQVFGKPTSLMMQFITLFEKYFQIVEYRFRISANFTNHSDFVSKSTKHLEVIEELVSDKKSEVREWSFFEMPRIFEQLTNTNEAEGSWYIA